MRRRTLIAGAIGALFGQPASAALVAPALVQRDDTAYLHGLINEARRTGKPAYVPAGTYWHRTTVIVPQGMRIMGGR